jgi:hypothetical protein
VTSELDVVEKGAAPHPTQPRRHVRPPHVKLGALADGGAVGRVRIEGRLAPMRRLLGVVRI